MSLLGSHSSDIRWCSKNVQNQKTTFNKWGDPRLVRSPFRINRPSTPKGPIKVKIKVRTLVIAPPRKPSPQNRSGMAQREFQFSCTPTRSSAIGMSHTCLCLPSCSWYSSTDAEGWKAELAWVAGYVVRQITCPKAILSHPTTNRTQWGATALIETNASPPD